MPAGSASRGGVGERGVKLSIRTTQCHHQSRLEVSLFVTGLGCYWMGLSLTWHVKQSLPRDTDAESVQYFIFSSRPF